MSTLAKENLRISFLAPPGDEGERIWSVCLYNFFSLYNFYMVVPQTTYWHSSYVYSYIYRVSQKNAILTLEVNISGLKAPIWESRTSFENYMFSAFIWAPKQVNSVPISIRKLGFKNLT